MIWRRKNGRYEPQDVIEIFDMSFTDNGTSGMILTTDAICVYDQGNRSSKFIVEYEDILCTEMEYTVKKKREHVYGLRYEWAEYHLPSMLTLELEDDVTYNINLLYYFYKNGEVENDKGVALMDFLDQISSMARKRF